MGTFGVSSEAQKEAYLQIRETVESAQKHHNLQCYDEGVSNMIAYLPTKAERGPMSIFNFIPYKVVRAAYSYKKKWVYKTDKSVYSNRQVILDFMTLMARHRLSEGFKYLENHDGYPFVFIHTIQIQNYSDEKVEGKP